MKYNEFLGRSLRVAPLLCLLFLASCSSIGRSSFGGPVGNITPVAGIENYSPDDALVHAKLQFRNANYGQSATLYKRAVELNPTNSEAMLGLAASYDRLRRFDLSDRVYAQLFRQIGGTAQFYNNVGYSYLLRGDLRNARDNFLRARGRDPDNVVIANNLALLDSGARAVQS